MAFQAAIALVLCFIASTLFGSQFVMMRKYKPGDGMFAQWMMCLAIWAVGFGMFIWTGYRNFYPLAMVGGAFWAAANLMSVPIINVVGLGMAVLLNSVTQCVSAFSISTFGLFWTKARPSDRMWLSVLGLIVVLIGGVLTSFVKGKPLEVIEHKPLTNGVPKTKRTSIVDILTKPIPPPPQATFHVAPHHERILAMAAAFVQGIMAAMNIVPVVAIQDHPEFFNDVEAGGMPYVFSMYCGIFLTSTLAFVTYALVKKNKPYINQELALPALLSGLMWGVAQTMTIVATEHLSQAVAGPITSMVPGCVATLWSLLYFKEIQGGKNLYVLTAALCSTLAGAVLIGMGKMDF